MQTRPENSGWLVIVVRVQVPPGVQTGSRYHVAGCRGRMMLWGYKLQVTRSSQLNNLKQASNADTSRVLGMAGNSRAARRSRPGVQRGSRYHVTGCRGCLMLCGYKLQVTRSSQLNNLKQVWIIEQSQKESIALFPIFIHARTTRSRKLSQIHR
jgi:hypothetical protein